MSGFLLDTNICIFFSKELFGIGERMTSVGLDACSISEITYAELLFGVENSHRPLQNKANLELFITDIKIIPITSSLRVFAFEKARLRRIGKSMEDFDLLIGATAIHHDLILVTNNTRHFHRMQGIKLEDWTK